MHDYMLKTNASILKLGDKLNQLATALINMEGNAELFAQLETMLMFSAITLRSGRTLNESGRTLNEHDIISLSEDEPKSVNVESNTNEEKKVPSNLTACNDSSSSNVVRNYIAKPLFPS